MIRLIIIIAVLGVIVGLVREAPKIPDIFKVVIYIVAAICLAFLLMSAFGIGDVPVPQLR